MKLPVMVRMTTTIDILMMFTDGTFTTTTTIQTMMIHTAPIVREQLVVQEITEKESLVFAGMYPW